MLLRTPFLPGDTDLDQLGKIFQALGSPTEDSWPNHTKLPDYVQFKEYPGTPLQDIFTAATPDLLKLIEKLLALCPLRRCNCTEALQMGYFKNKPYPSPGHVLPLPLSVRERDNPEPESKRIKSRLQNVEKHGLVKKLVF